jgi:four helix bundle protein
MAKFDLDSRLIAFGTTIGRVVNQLPGDRLGTHIASQLIRCGTAPIAHHAEAQAAESRRDFVHKLRLALKELRESLAWLRLAARAELAPGPDLPAAVRECGELVAIFAASVRTAARHLGGTPNQERRVRRSNDEHGTRN